MNAATRIVFLICLPCAIMAYCLRYQVDSSADSCAYGDQTIAMGTTYTDTSKCMKCTCSASGLSCCGYGYAAGSIAIYGCEMKKGDNCTFTFVKKEDNSKLCCPGSPTCGF